MSDHDEVRPGQSAQPVRAGRSAQPVRAVRPGRLFTGVAWAVLLLVLWLCGREVTGLSPDGAGPSTGDIAAVGRPPRADLPPAHRPLGEALPRRLDIPGLDVRAPVVSRGLDERGALEPPPFDQPGVVGWYADGVTPGASGTALVVGHVDTETRPAVFYKVSTLKPGQKIRVVREDAEVAEFTIEDIQVLARDGFDAEQAYGPRRPGRAELRIVTCGGTFDTARNRYTANVVVSAYLTGTTA